MSRPLRRPLFPLAVLLLTLASGASAISRRHDVPDEDYRRLAADFPEVGRFSFGRTDAFGSAVLIAPQWALMASHNLMFGHDLAIEFGGQRYRIEWHVRHFAGLPQPNSADFNLDLALCRLERPVEGIAPAVLFTGRDEVGREVTVVGYGVPGDGAGGTPDDATSGTRRAGRNRIEAVGRYDRAITPDPEGRVLFYDFDVPPGFVPAPENWFEGSAEALPLEAMMTSGDSGGGVFASTPGGRRLVGINSGCFGAGGRTAPTAGPRHVYGIGSRVMRISSFVDWIGEQQARYLAGREPLRGLIAHWSFDEADGDHAQDRSGTGHRGTVHHAVRVPGVAGGALEFRSNPANFFLPLAERDHVRVANETALFTPVGRHVVGDLKLRGDFTLAAWVRRQPSGGATGQAEDEVDTILAKTDAIGLDWAFVVWEQSLRLVVGDLPPVSSGPVAGLDRAGEWQHVAVARAGDRVTFHLDGRRVAEAVCAAALPTSDRPLLLGQTGGPGLDFSGRLDEVRIYDRALADAELARLAERPSR